MDDAVFWIDWIVTAISTFFLFMLAAAQQDRPLGTPQVFAALVVLGLGGMFIPFGFRFLCYDGHGRMKGWLYVIAADAVGLLILLSSVATGVSTYGS
ncbi:hypothetical protein [Streptomyces sp. GESEQ-35]|uniref:hypothetical protein n=1 Tax=Streptomyces sp. GESEQ-35 TaxID=2812657 RepID=UPI001B330DDA|nr:hypothetical protein [Streptomyces sp. GESEQ-35]